MFEDSLIESTRHIAKRRGWTTLVSTSIQIVLMAFLIILPLLRTNAISARLLQTPVLPPYIGPPTSTGSHPPSGTVDSGSLAPVIQVNPFSHVQHGWTQHIDTEGPSAPNICTLGCGTGPGVPDGVFDGGGPTQEVTLAKPPKPLSISHIDPGQIIRRVEPLYPPIAHTARIQGSVVLHAIISRQGTIEKLQVVSGHPMLDKAALDAVSQWLFRPYILNGQPIEVETEITVNFILDR